MPPPPFGMRLTLISKGAMGAGGRAVVYGATGYAAGARPRYYAEPLPY